MGASIRDNILFSHEYDEGFYNMVLDGKYFETSAVTNCMVHVHLHLYSMCPSSGPGALSRW